MKQTLNYDKMMTLVLCLFIAYGSMLIPVDALAQGPGGATIGNLLCNVADWFTGPVGQGIATLAILVIGIGALMGKVSWGMAIIVGIGVAVIFGAPAIVQELGTAGTGLQLVPVTRRHPWGMAPFPRASGADLFSMNGM